MHGGRTEKSDFENFLSTNIYKINFIIDFVNPFYTRTLKNQDQRHIYSLYLISRRKSSTVANFLSYPYCPDWKTLEHSFPGSENLKNWKYLGNWQFKYVLSYRTYQHIGCPLVDEFSRSKNFENSFLRFSYLHNSYKNGKCWKMGIFMVTIFWANHRWMNFPERVIKYGAGYWVSMGRTQVI